ncbi:MAG: 50S ribosomal protein L21 [Candidatus Dormibacteraceae bacterium]
MPERSGPLTAVVVSGGKQYRVAEGDRLLVDRVAAEPGAELVLDRVLLVSDGDDHKVTAEALSGIGVGARVVGHQRGKKIEVLRYKSKKRVRVHRGARADLSELEILSIGPARKGAGSEKKSEKKDDAAGESE